MSRFCEQCGKELEPDENFCPYCGAKVEHDEPPPLSLTSSTNNDKNDFDKVTKWGIVALIVLTVIGYTYKNQKNQDKPAYTPPATSAVSETKPAPPATLNKYDLKIGLAELGVKKENLEKIFGVGKVKNDGWYDYGDFWAKFDSSGSVYWISCMSPNLVTPRYIHVGSTLAELERNYNINQFRKEYAKNTINYECDLQDATLIFSILKSSNRIEEIVLVKKIKEPKPPAEKPKYSSDEYNYSCTVNGETTYKGISQRGLACALYSVEKQKRIISEFGFNHTARGTFYIVTVIVDNNTNEPIFAPSIYLMDERGRKFSSDISAESTWETMYGVESAFQLNPWQPAWVYKVFDIPDDATITSLRCEAEFTLEHNNFNIPFRVVTD